MAVECPVRIYRLKGKDIAIATYTPILMGAY